MTQRAFLLAPDFDSLWEAELRSRCEAAFGEAWKNRKPAIVVTPSRSLGFLIRERAVESGLDSAGVFFWTPGQCRRYLFDWFSDLPQRLLPENLRLLLGTIAQRASDDPVGRSVASDPGPLLDTMEKLIQAGWNPSEHLPGAFGDIAKRFLARLVEEKMLTSAQAERWILERIEAANHRGESISSRIKSLFLVGFTSCHWPLVPVLRSLVSLSESSLLAFIGNAGSEVDHDWRLHWEGVLGPVQMAVRQTPIERQPVETTFRIGATIRQQAEVIALQAVEYLAREDCTRLGILFPGRGPLARETAVRLQEWNIPLEDDLGYSEPPKPADDSWAAWLALQRDWQMSLLMKFMHSSPAVQFWFEERSTKIPDTLQNAFGEMMTEDLSILTQFLLQSESSENRTVAEVLLEWPRLPEEAPLEDFLVLTREALSKWEDANRPSALRDKAAFLTPEQFPEPIRRDLFIKWLEEAAPARKRLRREDCHHAFARVQLLRYPDAEGQNWSHLILTGLNETAWPPSLEPSGILRDRKVEELNRSVRPSSSSSGNACRAMIPGIRQKQALHRQRFHEFLVSTSRALCATAVLADESSPGAAQAPSEYMIDLYYGRTGEALTDTRMQRIQTETEAWLNVSKGILPKLSGGEDPSRTAIAYAARRAEGVPFREYEYALVRLPKKPLTLSCKDWETALRYPAIQWMESVLGVEPPPEREARWGVVSGTWVHRWLNESLSSPGHGGFVPFPESDSLMRKIEQRAEATRVIAERAFLACNRPLPVWWHSSWGLARNAALQLGLALGAVEDWPWLASEFSLPRETRIDLGDGRFLRLTGRLDLILTNSIVSQWNKKGDLFIGEDKPEELQCVLGDRPVWIVDFKTGNLKAIHPDAFWKGEGLQLGLYALALSRMGSGEVYLGVAAPGFPIEQVPIREQLPQLEPLWSALCRMQDTGCFGMKGEIRPEFGQSDPYPLATLAIDPDLLAAKWELTHPDLVPEEES